MRGNDIVLYEAVTVDPTDVDLTDWEEAAEGMRTARGILIGVVFSTGLWIALAAAVWAVL